MTRSLPALVAVLVLLATLPGVAAAESRTGGTVVVGPDETVGEDLEAVAGSVVIRGTVDGDVSAFAGDVRVAPGGTVTGNVTAAAGTVVIDGTVNGNVAVGGGSVLVTDRGRIDGSLQAGAGSIDVNGTVGGDAQLGAETVRLGPGAAIGGDLTYDGELVRAEEATIDGTVTRDAGLDVVTPISEAPVGLLSVYGLLVNLLIGAVLLYAFPRFSAGVADRVADDPARTGGAGLLALVAIPVAIALLFVTVVGIPLALAGLVLFGLLVWIATIYGRYAIGEWVLSATDWEGRWLALLVGVVGVAVLTFVPFVGWVVELIVFLLGFGALVVGLWRGYRGRSSRGERSDADLETV